MDVYPSAFFMPINTTREKIAVVWNWLLSGA